jgi:hypothetical protein
LFFHAKRNVGPGGITPQEAKKMLTWIVGGLSFWTLGFLFVLALMRMASDQDRDARHEELS